MARVAAHKAAQDERRFWLGVLEQLDQGDFMVALYVRDLRRKLGIKVKAPVEVIRAQTRERVRRFRERRRMAAERHAARPS